MIKKIIFDVDDTLIINDKNAIKDYRKVLRKYGGVDSDEAAMELYKCIGDYEISTHHYQKDTLLDFINNYFNKDYPLEFIDDIINIVNSWYHKVSPELIDTLEYLSRKYELDILTNWFIESQIKRLESAEIKDYFTEFIGPDKFVKPSIESFTYFLKDCKPSECMIIGDRFDIDIKTPLKLGMNAILYDVKNKYNDFDCVRISNWNEIKNIL